LGATANIHLLPPLSFLPFVRLMERADVILTDSGGIQEEAPALGRPVLVMRDVTERPEAVACGTASLVGTDPARIAGEAARLLDDEPYYAGRARPAFPFGDGRAAERIAAAIGDHLKEHP
jgi:UDP-N-acetylglucosamine 2-epimerase (non-hydrolysing)